MLDELVTTEAHLEAGAQTAQRLNAAADPPRLDELAPTRIGATAALSLNPARAAELEWQGNFAPISLVDANGNVIEATVFRTQEGTLLVSRLSDNKDCFMPMCADNKLRPSTQRR